MFPFEAAVLLGRDRSYVIDLHVLLGTILAYLAVGMVIGKTLAILLRLPRKRGQRGWTDFIIANHWFFLASSILAQYVVMMYSRRISEILRTPRPVVKSWHSYIGYAILIQVLIVTGVRQWEGAVAYYKDQARKNAVEAAKDKHS